MIRLLLGIAAILLLYLLFMFPRLSRRRDMAAFRGTLFAHRGYHDPALGLPENSLGAYQRAIEAGFGIEIDVHLTRDRELIVFHDHDLQRLCGVPGRVEDWTLAALTPLRLQNTEWGIPTLAEVLALVAGRVPLLIELKVPGADIAISSRTYAALHSYSGPYLIQSFQPFVLRWFKRHAPEVLRGQLSENMLAGPGDTPWFLRFMVTTLLTNLLARPDFISFKLADTRRFSTFLLHRLLRLPYAVWTLRTPDMLADARSRFDMYIFEDLNLKI